MAGWVLLAVCLQTATGLPSSDDAVSLCIGWLRAVLDTGVDPDHEQFLTNVGGTSRVAPGYSARTVSGGSVEGRDCNG